MVSKQKYTVEAILDKEGDRYLLKWHNYDVATWEPIGNLDCSDLIKKWQQLTGREQRQIRKTYKASSSKRSKGLVIAAINLAPLSEVTNTARTVTFIKKDLTQGTYGGMITNICAQLGIRTSQLLLTWASPDCRTYARADSSNISRGNHYRSHHINHRPPKDEVDDKRMMAIQHDLLAQSLLKSFLLTKASDPAALFVMENPSASLHCRTFVRAYETLLRLNRHLVNYCAYLAEVLKPTDIWTNFEWTPRGFTGDGRCHRTCHAGEAYTWADGRSFYRHPKCIAGPAGKSLRGTFASSKVPKALHHEILQSALP